TNVFGRTLNDLMADGLSVKINEMPDEAKTKMRRTITKIVNEGKGGVLCILL
ncbi:stage IV sporulation protein A, partial [Xanthomonas citri pv. citri]|nr:stage IV sporulation protein A [Xanthomonas citri pv. citri]